MTHTLGSYTGRLLLLLLKPSVSAVSPCLPIKKPIKSFPALTRSTGFIRLCISVMSWKQRQSPRKSFVQGHAADAGLLPEDASEQGSASRAAMGCVLELSEAQSVLGERV